jgi:L-malate glycosyltransferase
MKILHTVESYLPARHGMAEVVRQLSEGLVKRGHQVTVATSVDSNRASDSIAGVKVVAFDLSGNLVRGMEGTPEKYINFVKAGDFDLVTCFAAQQWATDALLPHLSALKARKVFVPTGFSALHDPAYKGYFEQMPAWLRSFDVNVFLSDTYQDAAFAQKQGISNTVLIPNGAASEEFAPLPSPFIKKKLGIRERTKLILHVGSYTGEKGHQEAIELFLNARIRNATLLFVGQNPERIMKLLGGRRKKYLELPKQYLLSGKKIRACSLSREETVQAFKEADLFLFPSRIECSPIVLFEAAAAGTPFLSTEVGNAREIADWTGGGRIIPTTFRNTRGYADTEAGGRMLEELARDQDLRNKMGTAARAAWQQHFTWEKITERYEQLYLDLLHDKPLDKV